MEMNKRKKKMSFPYNLLTTVLFQDWKFFFCIINMQGKVIVSEIWFQIYKEPLCYSKSFWCFLRLQLVSHRNPEKNNFKFF